MQHCQPEILPQIDMGDPQTDSKSRQMVDLVLNLVLCARQAIWRLKRICVEKVEQTVTESLTSAHLQLACYLSCLVDNTHSCLTILYCNNQWNTANETTFECVLLSLKFRKKLPLESLGKYMCQVATILCIIITGFTITFLDYFSLIFFLKNY